MTVTGMVAVRLKQKGFLLVAGIFMAAIAVQPISPML
jgi:hypothetical protein